MKAYSQISLAEQRFVFNYISDSSNNNCVASGTNTSEPLKWFSTSMGRGGRAKKGINQQFWSESNLFSEEKTLILQSLSTPEMCSHKPKSQNKPHTWVKIAMSLCCGCRFHLQKQRYEIRGSMIPRHRSLPASQHLVWLPGWCDTALPSWALMLTPVIKQ